MYRNSMARFALAQLYLTVLLLKIAFGQPTLCQHSNLVDIEEVRQLMDKVMNELQVIRAHQTSDSELLELRAEIQRNAVKLNNLQINLGETRHIAVANLGARSTVSPVNCNVSIKSFSAYDGFCRMSVDGYVFLNGEMVWEAGYCSYKPQERGVSLLTVDPVTCTYTSLRRFDTWFHDDDADELVARLMWLGDGTVVVGVSGDEPTHHLAPALRTLRAAGVWVDDVQTRGRFAFVMQKGHPGKTRMVKSNATEDRYTSTLSVNIQGYPDNLKFTTVAKTP